MSADPDFITDDDARLRDLRHHWDEQQRTVQLLLARIRDVLAQVEAARKSLSS